MPTGYTATLVEKGQTFQDFIMGCARAFGALIDMRDDPHDAPIPDKFEPSEYHAKQIIDSREKLAMLKAMTDTAREAFGQAEKDAEINRLTEVVAGNIAENNRLDDMAAQVRAWNPPTDDHKGLKEFMLQQIRISKNEPDYYQNLAEDAEKKTAMAYYIAAVSECARNVKYHTEEHSKEVERVSGRTEWVRQLRASIGQ